MAERQQTMGEYLVGKVGLLKATKVAAFIVAWGIYLEKTEAPYQLDRYSDYWKQSRATTYRERDLFRICFPSDKVPTRVWGLCRQVYDGKKADRELSTVRLLTIPGSWS